MVCPGCNAPNPEGKNYCGDCGRSIAPSERLVAHELRAGDQKLAEYELTEKVAARLEKWVKWFGVWIGVPVAVGVIVLAMVGFAGFQSLRDFQNTVTQASENVKGNLETARTSFDELEASTEHLRTRASKIDTDLTAAAQLGRRVDSVQADLQKLRREIEQWYASLMIERFKVQDVKFTMSKVRDGYDVELRLKQAPIPASLRVYCRNFQVPDPAAIKVSGRTIQSPCDYGPDDGDNIILVTYHPR